MRTDLVENETVAEAPYDWRRDGWLAACAAAVALLVISAATPPAPGYDKFLRIFVFCVAVVRAFAAFRRGGAWLPLSAWFAIAGAWQLLRRWQPQRGWAAAAVSLAAVAVPAVAAMNMPNRDALTPAELNENRADLNVTVAPAPAATAAAPSTPEEMAGTDSSAAPPRAEDAIAAPAPGPHLALNAQADGATNRASAATAEHPAPLKTVQAPPFPGNDAVSTDSATAPVNNDSTGNQEIGH